MTSTLLPPSFPPRPAPESVRVVDEPAAVPSPVQTAPERVSAPPKPPRDGFLDTVRSIALVRVVIWHAFGVPWISWVIATMPTMFFVAGSLLASTLDRKPIGVMYRSRLKRLLVPYWLFAGSVLSVLSIVHLAGPSSETALRPDQVLPWLVPFTDPTGPAWEAGWAASPLWYLRAYLWLLLLSPILRAAVRRFGAASLAPMLLATAAIELWLHNPTVLPIPLGTWTWMLRSPTKVSNHPRSSATLPTFETSID